MVDSKVRAVTVVKSLELAKSKLGRVLKPEERRALVLCMLEDVLGALKHAGIPTLVVSPDEEVLKFAGCLGCGGVKDEGKGVNRAFELGREEAVRQGSDSVLLLPADLPLLRAWEVQRILETGGGERFVVLSPTQRGGTGALHLRPPTVIPLRFEGGSFSSHFAEALRAGLKPKVFRSAGTFLDLDEPGDIPRILCLGDGTRTKEFLAGLSPRGTGTRD
jgi:2-phospho-L-lactate guanylyltransferase